MSNLIINSIINFSLFYGLIGTIIILGLSFFLKKKLLSSKTLLLITFFLGITLLQGIVLICILN